MFINTTDSFFTTEIKDLLMRALEIEKSILFAQNELDNIIFRFKDYAVATDQWSFIEGELPSEHQRKERFLLALDEISDYKVVYNKVFPDINDDIIEYNKLIDLFYFELGQIPLNLSPAKHSYTTPKDLEAFLFFYTTNDEFDVSENNPLMEIGGEEPVFETRLKRNNNEVDDLDFSLDDLDIQEEDYPTDICSCGKELCLDCDDDDELTLKSLSFDEDLFLDKEPDLEALEGKDFKNELTLIEGMTLNTPEDLDLDLECGSSLRLIESEVDGDFSQYLKSLVVEKHKTEIISTLSGIDWTPKDIGEDGLTEEQREIIREYDKETRDLTFQELMKGDEYKNMSLLSKDILWFVKQNIDPKYVWVFLIMVCGFTEGDFKHSKSTKGITFNFKNCLDFFRFNETICDVDDGSSEEIATFILSKLIEGNVISEHYKKDNYIINKEIFYYYKNK